MNSSFSWEQLSHVIINLKKDLDRQRLESEGKPQGALESTIQKWTSGTELFTRGELGGLLLDGDVPSTGLVQNSSIRM